LNPDEREHINYFLTKKILEPTSTGENKIEPTYYIVNQNYSLHYHSQYHTIACYVGLISLFAAAPLLFYFAPEHR
jgi:hypothetical protein